MGRVGAAASLRGGFCSPESAEKDSELSALSCPDVTTDFTDRCSSRCDCFSMSAKKDVFSVLHTHTQSCLCCFDIFVSPLKHSELTTGEEGQRGAALLSAHCYKK